jgi:cell division protein FtsQ
MWKLGRKKPAAQRSATIARGTQRNPKPARRRRPAPRWLRPALKYSAFILLIGGVLGTPVWLWRTGVISTWLQTAEQSVIAYAAGHGLTVQEVLLEGRRYTSQRQVNKAVGLKRGDPILSIDPEEIRQRLVALAWVQDAVVERHLPDTIYIRIRERQPMALWQRKGKLALVDVTGRTITRKNLGRFRDLMIIAGRGARRETPTLIAMLNAEPGLAERVVGAVWVGKRRWNIKLRDGIRVRLPEDNPHLAWRKLATLNAQFKLLARDIRIIDMRLPDRLILKPGGPGVKIPPGRGRAT